MALQGAIVCSFGPYFSTLAVATYGFGDRGFAVLLANGWILILTPLVVYFLQRLAILPEEAYLERKFGDGYRAYKRRVRRWL